MTRVYFSPPYGIIILLLLAILILIFGWYVLLYFLIIIILVPLCTIIYDRVTHDRTCRECKAAVRYLRSRHPDRDYRTGLRSHRAKEATRMVIAVFHEMPDQSSRPPPYELVSVSYDLREIYLLNEEGDEKYRIKNYK